MEYGNPNKTWWQAVESIAVMMTREGFDIRDMPAICSELSGEGFSSGDINKASGWVEQVFVTGKLQEVVSMLAPDIPTKRMLHPVEQLTLPEGIVRHLQECRDLGIFNSEVSERLLEGLRSLDTRDWDSADVSLFISEVLENAGSAAALSQYQAFTAGVLKEQLH